ncbi:MAG: TlpA disulfide reductase family protein [Alphaproteobacteria bacterium]
MTTTPDKTSPRFPPWARRGAVVAIGLAIALAAIIYGLQTPSTDRAGQSTVDGTEQATLGAKLLNPEEQRASAPLFKMQTASFGDGSVFDLEAQRGNIVVMFYMAGWCLSCIPEAQALARLHRESSSQGVTILAIDMEPGESESELASFREQAGGGEHLWAVDREGVAIRSYQVQTLDTTVAIDRKGRVAYRDERITDYETLAAVVTALMSAETEK